MRKLFILLAVLIATPVFALSIDMNEVSPGVVEIQYSDANALNLPRAFALEFTVDAPATITLNPTSYIQGESTSGTPGFGIYPARIVIDGNGNPTSYGSPLADPLDPGAGDGDGSGNVVLEFGSLYVGDGNAPLTGDTLCTLTIDCNGAEVDVNLTMVDEDLIRGGVLLEDGTPVPVDQTILITCAAADCFPGGPDGALYLEWVAVGKPDCWCAEINPRQCHGDADNYAESPGKGNYWVLLNDLAVLKAAWSKNFAAIDGQTTTVSKSTGPENIEWICADFDHAVESPGKGNYRVLINDLKILKANWSIANKPDPNCADLGY